MLQIVASHIDDSRGINYDFNMFIVQATDVYAKLSAWNLDSNDNLPI